MNDLLYQFQTIGFACDREYHKGMKEVKRSFQEINKFKERTLKNYNNVDNVIDSITNIIHKKKQEPLSKSVDCRTLSKTQRLQKCLNRMSKIDHDQQQLDRESGIRATRIFSEKINDFLPLQQLKEREMNEELLLDCHLQDQNKFRKVMEQAILLRQFHKDCSQRYNRYQKCDLKSSLRQRSKDKSEFNKQNEESIQIQEFYMQKYQMEHMRLKEKLIDSEKKTLIEHKYCLDRTQLIKSERNRKKIREVTEKLNRNKITVIQNLFKTGHIHKSQQASEVLKFLDLYSKLDRDNQGLFSKQIEIDQNISLRIDTYLRRIFFKFSNDDGEDQNSLYKYMNKENYVSCFRTSNLDIEDFELEQIYTNNIKLQCIDSEKGLNYNFFRDSLIDIANCITLLQSKEEKILLLVKEYLTEIYDQVLEPNDLRLLNMKAYQEFNQLFVKVIQYLFALHKQECCLDYQYEDRINLDRIIQIFMKIKVFPNKFSKGVLRYYYNYVLEQDDGLNIEQFHHFVNLLALSQNKRLCITKELNNIIQYNNFKLNQKCDDISEFELKLLRKIMIFYFHHDFLNLLIIDND